MRFHSLSKYDVAMRVGYVHDAECVQYDQSGIDAAMFTEDGDMLIALNTIQSTVNGFAKLNAENFNKVCDQPHPTAAKKFLNLCIDGDIDAAIVQVTIVVDQGFTTNDIIQTMFRMAKSMELTRKS